MHRVSGELLRSGLAASAQRNSSVTASAVLTLLRGGHFGRVSLHSQSATPAVGRRAYVTKAAQEPFLNGSSSVYVEEMYKCWKVDPNSVHKSWDTFFRSATAGLLPGQAYQSPPSISGTAAQLNLAGGGVAQPVPKEETHLVSHRHIDDHLSVQAIIRSYQVRCWFVCSNIDDISEQNNRPEDSHMERAHEIYWAKIIEKRCSGYCVQCRQDCRLIKRLVSSTVYVLSEHFKESLPHAFNPGKLFVCRRWPHGSLQFIAGR